MSRKRSVVPIQRTSTKSWIVLALVIILLAINSVFFTVDWGELITGVLSMIVGANVGNFLMLGAFRRFGWGESAARSIFVWSVVGGLALILVVGIVVGDAMDARQPNLATIAYYTFFGGALGVMLRAYLIRGQQRTEDRP
jgi:uncharacterized membrane protein YdcZ (DUF606 family)